MLSLQRRCSARAVLQARVADQLRAGLKRARFFHTVRRDTGGWDSRVDCDAAVFLPGFVRRQATELRRTTTVKFALRIG